MIIPERVPEDEVSPKGKMNIAFEEDYDQEDDIYTVSFRSEEPSYVDEVEDNLLVEVGMFTGMPTGFRILNFKKANIGRVVFEKAVTTIFESARDRFKSDYDSRERRFGESLEKVLA